MAKYLTNKETQVALENLIRNSEQKLILVSPYIKLSNYLLSLLRFCGEKGLIVKILYRKEKVTSDELIRLKTIKNVELKFTYDLHAKCYFNEKEMIITSLNLLSTSEDNWEMGVLINRNEDNEIFSKAMRDVQIMFNDSNEYEQPIAPINKFIAPETPKSIKSKVVLRHNNKDGYCIRCDEGIPFDKDKPLCRECYKSWNEWEDDEYPENFCHFTGEESDGETCFAKPILNKNWKEAKKIHGL